MMSIHTGRNNHYQAMLAYAIGDNLMELIEDASVLEIQVNPDGSVWIDTTDRGLVSASSNLSYTHREKIIRLIASSVGAEATTENPSVYAEIPEFNARFQAQLPPVVDNPCFVIRKLNSSVFSLADYYEKKSITKKQFSALVTAIWSKKSILVVGGTNSGKTTLANALLLEISRREDERIVIIEDTKELICHSENAVQLRAQRNGMNMNDLLKDALRLSPKRIVVGEVRGKEALALIMAWNVGHSGIATLHANSCRDSLTRLEMLLSMAGITHGHKMMIATAIDLIVFIERDKSKWTVRELASLNIEDDRYILETV